MDVEELSKVRNSLGSLLGKEYIKSVDTDDSGINKIVSLSGHI